MREISNTRLLIVTKLNHILINWEIKRKIMLFFFFSGPHFTFPLVLTHQSYLPECLNNSCMVFLLSFLRSIYSMANNTWFSLLIALCYVILFDICHTCNTQTDDHLFQFFLRKDFPDPPYLIIITVQCFSYCGYTLCT